MVDADQTGKQKHRRKWTGGPQGRQALSQIVAEVRPQAAETNEEISEGATQVSQACATPPHSITLPPAEPVCYAITSMGRSQPEKSRDRSRQVTPCRILSLATVSEWD